MGTVDLEAFVENIVRECDTQALSPIIDTIA